MVGGVVGRPQAGPWPLDEIQEREGLIVSNGLMRGAPSAHSSPREREGDGEHVLHPALRRRYRLRTLSKTVRVIYVTRPLWDAKSNSLLPAEDVDVLSKPSTKQSIQDATWRKYPAIIKTNCGSRQRRRTSVEQPKNKRGNKPEAISISNLFNRETFLLNKTPKGRFCVAPIVTQLFIQTCPETLKGRNIDQESASWF